MTSREERTDPPLVPEFLLDPAEAGGTCGAVDGRAADAAGSAATRLDDPEIGRQKPATSGPWRAWRATEPLQQPPLVLAGPGTTSATPSVARRSSTTRALQRCAACAVRCAPAGRCGRGRPSRARSGCRSGGI